MKEIRIIFQDDLQAVIGYFGDCVVICHLYEKDEAMRSLQPLIDSVQPLDVPLYLYSYNDGIDALESKPLELRLFLNAVCDLEDYLER